MDDHVSVQKNGQALGFTRSYFIYNRIWGHFPSNGVFRQKHTFEELNNLFVPLKSCKCTTVLKKIDKNLKSYVKL